MIANEGNIIAVEYGQRDRDTMEENVVKFGLQNVTVLSEVTEQTMQGLPVPRLAFWWPRSMWKTKSVAF